MSHKPGGRLPLLFTRPAVTLATLEGCYQFHCLVNRWTMGMNSLPKTVTWKHRGCDLNLGSSAHLPLGYQATCVSYLRVLTFPWCLDIFARHQQWLRSTSLQSPKSLQQKLSPNMVWPVGNFLMKQKPKVRMCIHVSACQSVTLYLSVWISWQTTLSCQAWKEMKSSLCWRGSMTTRTSLFY